MMNHLQINVYEEKEYFIPLNLQLFAKEGQGGEKTEEPTAKKLKDAREEGQVARSTELTTGVSLLVLFLVLKIYLATLGNSFLEVLVRYFNYIGDYSKDEFNARLVLGIVSEVLLKIAIIALPVFLSAMLCALFVNVLQVQWKVTAKPLMPKGNKLNPISGFKKIFSKDKIFELIKAIVKIGVIIYIAYTTLSNQWKLILSFYNHALMDALALVGNIIINLGLKISILFAIIGVIDLLYQKMKYKKDLRMTKQEIKDEFKQSEGDPQIKGKIRSKMQEASRRRMMQDLPQADVVITNPTHLAVAIKYDREKDSAPVVIAKGADYLAMRIKDIARENDIVIVENKPLARMLYHNVELGDEVPEQLYQMVAEVLVYVYGIKNKLPQMQ